MANVLRGVQAIIIRSQLSLLLSPQELGSAFAYLEVLVSLVPFAVAPASTSLYKVEVLFICVIEKVIEFSKKIILIAPLIPTVLNRKSSLKLMAILLSGL